VALKDNGKPDFCVEVKWSDRNVDKPQRFSNLIEFCKRNQIEKAVITTKTRSQKVTFDHINFEFTPSAKACYFIGINASDAEARLMKTIHSY